MISRRYLEKSKNPHPHIGQMVLKVMRDKKISQAALARRLNVSPSTLSSYFKQSSIQFGVLWNLGVALDHDFLTELTNYYPSDIVFNHQSKLIEELTHKTNQIADLEKEIGIYKKALGIKD